MEITKTILIITDGIGHKENSKKNAFRDAKKPGIWLSTKQCSKNSNLNHGLSVGLPEGQMGNSEVGHMTIGAGRVLYQDLVKISLALESGDLEKK